MRKVREKKRWRKEEKWREEETPLSPHENSAIGALGRRRWTLDRG
jgi:hypothetical protein